MAGPALGRARGVGSRQDGETVVPELAHKDEMSGASGCNRGREPAFWAAGDRGRRKEFVLFIRSIEDTEEFVVRTPAPDQSLEGPSHRRVSGLKPSVLRRENHRLSPVCLY
jgi:hypothetical protein